MFKIRVFVKELSKMFLPEHIVYVDYAEQTVTVRGCQHSDRSAGAHRSAGRVLARRTA